MPGELPLDSVAPLGKDYGHSQRGAPGQGRRQANYDNITLKQR